MQPFFITASGTDIGKTLVTTTLTWQLRQQGKAVTALKPVLSGYEPEDLQGDTALILQSCGITPTPQLMETLSPWRYREKLAPNMAAAKEGNPVDLDKLVAFCREHAALDADVLLIEGIGGVMVPLSDKHTVLDWMQALGWPAIVVGGSYLGALSHTLMAFEVLQQRNVPVKALTISESARTTVSLDDTVSTLERFIPPYIPVVKIPRLNVRKEAWKSMPRIDWILEQGYETRK